VFDPIRTPAKISHFDARPVDHLDQLSRDGDPLEALAAMVEFVRFRPIPTRGLGYCDGAKGGRPPFDPVAMFKMLVVQAQHNPSDARMEFMIRGQLSWMCFFGSAPPPENWTICG
jgi:transposase